MGEAKNIAGEWGVDKSHGGEQKIRGGGLSRGVLLRGVHGAGHILCLDWPQRTASCEAQVNMRYD